MTRIRPGVDDRPETNLDGAGADAPPPPGAVDDSPRGWLFWTGLALGWAVMAYAVIGIRSQADLTNPAQLTRWVVGAAVVHDLLVAPIVTIVAIALAWRAPAWWGRPVAFAAGASAIVAVFATPLVRGFGRRVNNPSALPRDYTNNLAWVLAGIWGAAASVIAYRAVRRRRST